MLDDSFKQRCHVAAADIRLVSGITFESRCVNNREIQLLVGRAESVKQVEGLVDHPVRACAFPVDLVHNDNRDQALCKCLLRDEACLRHWPLYGIHKEQDAIDHGEHPLNLAAEVCVPGRVDDVDPVVVPVDGRVFRKDSNAALTLQVIGIHDAIRHSGARPEGSGMLQHLVDQCGLTMIDVSDDRNITKFG